MDRAMAKRRRSVCSQVLAMLLLADLIGSTRLYSCRRLQRREVPRADNMGFWTASRIGLQLGTPAQHGVVLTQVLHFMRYSRSSLRLKRKLNATTSALRVVGQGLDTFCRDSRAW